MGRWSSVLATAVAAVVTLTLILVLVNSMEERLGLTRKVGLARVVVNMLVAQTDRLAIMSYQATMSSVKVLQLGYIFDWA